MDKTLRAALLPAVLLLLFSFCSAAQKVRFEFYTKANGLVGNAVSNIMQDDIGLIWFLNEGKLMRYDGRRFLAYPLPAGLLQGNGRLFGMECYQDSLLFLHTEDQILILNPKNGKTASYPLPSEDGNRYTINKVMLAESGDILLDFYLKNSVNVSIYWLFRDSHFERLPLQVQKYRIDFSSFATVDNSGSLYIFSSGVLGIYDKSGNQTLEILVPRSNGGNGVARCAAFGKDNTLVVLADSGFFELDRGQQAFLPHPVDWQSGTLLRQFFLEKNGSIWACGPNKTLIYYNAALDTLYDFKQELEMVIQHDCDFEGVFQDKTGSIWVACQLGLLKVVPQTSAIDTYFTGLGSNKTYRRFRGLTEGAGGIVYGSYYGGSGKIDPEKKREYPAELPPNMPFGLYTEGERIWLNNGTLWNISTKTLQAVPGSISGQKDWGLFSKDKNGQLWWTYQTKLYYLDDRRQGLHWVEAVGLPGNDNYSADAIHAGKQSQQIWIGFMEQLFAYSATTKKLLVFGPKTFGLPITQIMAIEEDRTGNVWLGTDIGLICFNHSTGIVRHYSEKDGLANDNICGMQPEGDSCLWLSTSHGISRFHTKREVFTNFFKEDGFPDDEFNRGSTLKARNGRMFFGNMKGVVAFFPEALMKSNQRRNEAAHLVLSSFERVDERNDNMIKEYNFGQQPEIHVHQRERYFTFEYAMTDFSNPNGIRYSHRMEGYKESWSEPSPTNSARFSSLPSGEYVFRVRAKDGHGLWYPNELAVTVIVHPPWWATKWAYLAYVFLLLTLLYFFRRYELNRQAFVHNLELEIIEAEKLKELDNFKSKLYTNLTHEFRTPLTVILGMVGEIKKDPKKHLEAGIPLIERNSKSLLHLINQMLDLSKLDNKAFHIHFQQGNIVQYLRYVTESFQTFANSMNLSLRFFTAPETLFMDYDPEQLKQVLTNLISNAVKFTPSGGDVSVRIANSKEQLFIEVEDTGIGISENDLSHIFDRFYQAEDSHSRIGKGTGIGLTHTLELLKVMSGKIRVTSTLEKGSTFKVTLPITRNAPITIDDEYVLKPPPSPEDKADLKNPSPRSLPHLLLIEDNPDVVIYLKTCLGELYQMDVAYNGKIGIEKALENVPDLIISDLMMPEKDGYDVCDTLKNCEHTSHIPIILLTAKADAASKISGLRRGADAYIIKPFDKEELLVRLEMLVERQKRMVAHFSKNLHSGPLSTEASPEAEEAIKVENAFIQKLRQILEQNYGNENFALPQLCQKIGMSRSQLFRKMQAIVDTSPSDYIRSYRLNKAKMMLEDMEMNVTEVAWKVGYKDLAHFSKSFQEEFGMSPSATTK